MEARRGKKKLSEEILWRLNCDLGEAILDAFPEIRVDVHKPAIKLNVEIREKIYIYSEIIPGPGGMPVGTNGKAMLLLSGGIDSPVAGYMVSKNVELRWRRHISMHRRIQVNVQNQKVVDLAKTGIENIQDRSS